MADNNLQQAVAKFADQLAVKVSDFANNISTLEVYTSPPSPTRFRFFRTSPS